MGGRQNESSNIPPRYISIKLSLEDKLRLLLSKDSAIVLRYTSYIKLITKSRVGIKIEPKLVGDVEMTITLFGRSSDKSISLDEYGMIKHINLKALDK